MAESKIAILGGTFNPIHNGHIAMAEAAFCELGMSKIVFLPNGNPPHKNDLNMVDAHKRYDMVALAIEHDNRFLVSDYEVKRNKPSYTIDTLPYLKSVYGEDISYIIGADSLYTIHKWKEYRKLICQCKFIVADRNCDSGSDLKMACDALIKIGADITCMKMPKIDVTSTQIRMLAACGKNFSRYVPAKVYEYIINNKLYQPCTEDENDY